MANWDDYSLYTTPDDSDTALLHDVSETTVGAKMKRITWANIKATLKTYFDTLYLALVAPGAAGNVLTSDGTNWTSAAPTGGGGGASTPPGRLTLESGVPVSTTDQADKTTLYYTPYVGNQIMLYDGSGAWDTLTFSELSLNISAFTASKPYDIWAYNNAGTATLDSTVWTDATTRATALAYQDGRLVKSGDATRLYLGTIYMDAASKCQDTLTKRFVWNYYNRVNKKLYVHDSTDGWNYTTATWRAANNSTNNRFEVIVGVNEDVISSKLYVVSGNITADVQRRAGIGLDITNGSSSDIFGRETGNPVASMSFFESYVGVGYHFLQWVEWSDASGTTTWYGDGGNNTLLKSGMNGIIRG